VDLWCCGLGFDRELLDFFSLFCETVTNDVFKFIVCL
jgi:hypothetical protein